MVLAAELAAKRRRLCRSYDSGWRTNRGRSQSFRPVKQAAVTVAAVADLKIMEEKDEETITILSHRRRHCCPHRRSQASAIAVAAIPMRACREEEAAMQPVLGGRMVGANPLAVIPATSDEGLPEEDNLTVRLHGKIPTRLAPAIADRRGMRLIVKLLVGAAAGVITAVPAPQGR
jgi:hypothetical protein